jgi:UDPglucose--hexose-1-phosphate uridylyltransferase
VSLADQSLEQIERVLRVCRERLVDLFRDLRFRYVLVFKNHGMAAGASLVHPHTQIIATPVTPKIIAGELISAKEHYHLKERCLFCDIIRQELDGGERVILARDQFVALTPFASRFPFEIFLAPLDHHSNFAELSDDAIPRLASVFKEALLRIRRCLNDPPYNFVIHTAPNVRARPRRTSYWDTIEADWHWHIEIMPRLTHVAGFEWGTGFYINPTAPEEAARYLREVEV